MSQLKVNTIRHTGASSDAIALATDGTCTVKATNNLSNRNLIINGAMRVAQRGTTSTSNGYKTIDRWYWECNGADEAATIAQVDVTSNDSGPWEKGFTKALRVTNGNQTSGAGASDAIDLVYAVEAQDLVNSGWIHTSSSSYITLSFWVKSSVAQNFYGYIRSQDGTMQDYAYETGSLSADTWTKITKKIPGSSGMTIDNDNGKGWAITLLPFMGTGSTNNSKSLNSWANIDNAARTPDNTSTWWTTNDAQFETTGWQLEVGEVATEFEHRSYQDELLRCARYHQEQQGHSDLFMEAGKGQGTSSCDVGHALVVPMRASPTVVCGANRIFMWDGYSGSSSAPTVTSWDANHSIHSSVISLNLPGHSGITNNEVVSWCPHSSLLTFDAEI